MTFPRWPDCDECQQRKWLARHGGNPVEIFTGAYRCPRCVAAAQRDRLGDCLLVLGLPRENLPEDLRELAGRVDEQVARVERKCSVSRELAVEAFRLELRTLRDERDSHDGGEDS